MKKGLLVVLCLIFASLSGVYAQERGMGNPKAVFIEKGTRSAGLSMGWNTWDANGEDGVNVLGIITGVKGTVNLFDIAASGAWFLKDNLSVGLRVGFSDARVDIDSTRFLGNDVQDRHLIREVLKGSVLTGQTGFYKNYNQTDRGKEGTYTGLGSVSLGLYPGVSVFATKNISFEFSLPLLEGGYTWNGESSTDYADASLNHGFVRFKPSLTGFNMGLVFHF